MHAHLQVVVTSRQACVLGSMCLIMMILTGFAGVAPHQVFTLALPPITQQTHLVVSNRVRIILKTVALHVVSNLCHIIWEGLLSLASKNFNSFKDFQSDQIQTSSRKLFTAHFACRNSDLNLTPVTGTTNGFTFQIINSLIESWGVRLTCFGCKANTPKMTFLTRVKKVTKYQYWP